MEDAMAVRIEKGGWILIFLVGLALVGYGLNRYGLFHLGKRSAASSQSSGNAQTNGLDTSKPLSALAAGAAEAKDVRVRVNIWVGCAAGLVANGGLETAPGSIFADEGLNVPFKIIDDWTEGAAALATDNEDVKLTPDDVWAERDAERSDRAGQEGLRNQGGEPAARRCPARQRQVRRAQSADGGEALPRLAQGR